MRIEVLAFREDTGERIFVVETSCKDGLTEDELFCEVENVGNNVMGWFKFDFETYWIAFAKENENDKL